MILLLIPTFDTTRSFSKSASSTSPFWPFFELTYAVEF